MRVLKNYLKDPDTNIFKNYIDALFGVLVLLMLPAISIVLVCISNPRGYIEYAFSIQCVVFASLYDAYARYEYKHPRNSKLAFRSCLNVVALLVALALKDETNVLLKIIAPTLLSGSGLLILSEAVHRIKTAIEISRWNY